MNLISDDSIFQFMAGINAHFLLVLKEAIHLSSVSCTSAPSGGTFCQLVEAVLMEIFIQRTFQIQRSSTMLISGISVTKATWLAQTRLASMSNNGVPPPQITRALHIQVLSVH